MNKISNSPFGHIGSGPFQEIRPAPPLKWDGRIRQFLATLIGVRRYEKILFLPQRLSAALECPPVQKESRFRPHIQIGHGACATQIKVIDQAGRVVFVLVHSGSPSQERQQLLATDYPVARIYHTGWSRFLRNLPSALWILVFWRRLASLIMGLKLRFLQSPKRDR